MIVRLHRGLLLAALLFGLAAVVPASAAALSDEVQVQAPGNSSKFENVSLSGLGAPTTHTYSINGANEQLTGYTLSRVLDGAASVSPAFSLTNVTSVQVDRPQVTSGGNAFMTINKADFSVGPPLFFEEAGAVKFVNPSGPRILTFSNAIPAVKLVASTSSSVIIVALPADAKAGETVNFAAQTSGTAANESTTESWTFGDGSAASGSGTHIFKKKGKYKVQVKVTGNKGFSGSAIYNYVVDPEKTKKKPKKKDDPPANTNSDDGSSTPGNGYGSGGTGYGDPGSNYGSNVPSPGPSAPAPKPAPEPEPAPPVDDGLVEISGELVSSTAPATTMSPSEAGATEPPPEETPEASGFALSAEAMTGIGLLLLFALGMLAERRGSRLS